MARRTKVFKVEPSFLIYALNGFREGKALLLPIDEQIPEGAEVVHLWSDWDRRCLMMEVEHESYEIVPDGECPPYSDFKTQLAFRRIDLLHSWEPMTKPAEDVMQGVDRVLENTGLSDEPSWRDKEPLI